jgi:hypothetical protein
MLACRECPLTNFELTPDVTAIEYAVIAGSPKSPDTTGWSKREGLSDDTTGWARREDSKDDTTGWSKREDSPDATMVEYALNTSAEQTK